MHVVGKMSGNGDRPGLAGMNQLPMIAARPVNLPAILSKQFQQLANFHAAMTE
jgi:hypothetical protein